MKQFDLSLYLVLDPDLCRAIGMVETARLAVLGGATMVQLRDKQATTVEMIATGLQLKAALSGTGVSLIVNDDVEAALAIGADGIHVGQEDMNATEVRKRVGDRLILGLSVETEDLARRVDPAVVDYVGVGPVFATGTKPDHKQPIGFEGLARIVAASPIPAVAIGGVKVQHVEEIFRAGAKGLAVVSAICGSPDPQAATRLIADKIAEAKK
ncbi:thiamine phosphate synthase [Aliirhizobium cellulosilyticum]|jgi:thiamine-phosphate pyrophosphorylase|uniref:Thiamine-phosphate synthase n=1 Tax=Aliirhizobium cellulosilyticum TaxID=393664 RepID=A0A7W6TCQ1_9HYPH|nr:thiamine phosphate synthase [Rhizobium cellulosilyticum]MBB4347726.1 thiamine-phosphate pyrophosphorylase [Rhizobium cellulosilyticum]MBB4409880.1 thiamine-phosphate pyrophosphorylase [Rhizobium cellulosilyticum]MBB4444567.1 thiamine-phosphate pyrophosphorylase [Rhizobium cellulosilyticum]